MKKILTREEIDALLSDVAEGRIDPEKELAREQGGVVNYDLFNTMTHKGMMPNLDIVYDSFIRSLQGYHVKPAAPTCRDQEDRRAPFQIR